MNWYQLQYTHPERVDEFYNWLASVIKTHKLELNITFSQFFKLPTWVQIAIFFQYLKDSNVEVIDVNPLCDKDCIALIVDFFEAETQKKDIPLLSPLSPMNGAAL